MKVGEKGCLVGSEGSFEQVAGFPVRLVDTTGAGMPLPPDFSTEHWPVPIP